MELALFAGKIAAYAQGFAVMEAPPRNSRWNLPHRHHRPHLARRLHHPLALPRYHRRSLRTEQGPTNLLLAPDFVTMMQDATPRSAISWPAARRKSCRFRPLLGARLFRQLPPGARHRQSHPGPARFLRRPRLQAPGCGRRLPRPLGSAIIIQLAWLRVFSTRARAHVFHASNCSTRSSLPIISRPCAA